MGIQTTALSLTTERNFNNVHIPEHYLLIIANAIQNGDFNSSDGNFNRPILKSTIRSFYWIFVIQYAILAILGIVTNITIIVYTLYYKLFKDITHAFIINLSLCHVVQCAIVLPITLMVMIIQNWIFGQFLCFFLPMLQDIPFHVAIISHVLIAWDRMRWLGDPLKGRLPTFVCCCASWLTGMVIALPYPIYTLYIDIGIYEPQLQGIGVCAVNVFNDIHEYIRGLFVIMYCGPSILLAYLYIRTSQELRPPDGPFAVMMFEHRAELRNRQRNSSMSSNGRPRADSNPSYDLYSAELDVSCEKRTQRTLGSMAATQVICMCPVMVLKLAGLVVFETYENTKHFDFTYLMFVWIAFLPTVIFPCIYASEILPGTEKERLRGYFRLSSKRRLNKSQTSQEDSSIEQETTTTTAIEIPTMNNNNHKSQSKNEINKTSSMSESLSSQSGHHRNQIDKPTRSINQQNRHHSTSRESTSNESTSRELTSSAPNSKRYSRSVSAKDQQSRPPSRLSKLNSHNNSTNSSIRSSANGNAERYNHDKISSPGTEISGNQNLYPPRKSLTDSVNNSCSNITSSTYCNVSNIISGSTILHDRIESNRISANAILAAKRGSTDYDTESLISGSDTKPSLYGGIYDRKFNGSGINPIVASLLAKNRDISFDCGSQISYRSQGSSSTLDRDLEIIDLLERERSMDIQDMMERERHGERVRNYSITSERRRLPDLEKIKCQSPKIIESILQQQKQLNYVNNSQDISCVPTPPISAGTLSNQFDYPNATIATGYFTNHYHQLLPNTRRQTSRRSSNASSRLHSSLVSNASGKRDSLSSIQGMGCISTSPIIQMPTNDDDRRSTHSSNFHSDNISQNDDAINSAEIETGKVSVIERTNSGVNSNSVNRFRAARSSQRSSISTSSARSSSIKSNRLLRNSISCTPSTATTPTAIGTNHHPSLKGNGIYDRQSSHRSSVSESDGKSLSTIKSPPFSFEQNVYAKL